MKWLATLLSVLVSSSITFGAPKPLTKVQLLLNWHPEPEFGGFFAAQVSKTFEKHGLDVKIVEGGAGAPVAQMVATGKVEFGISNADEVVISRSRGAEVVALFAAYQTNPQGIMVHESRGFEKLEDVFKHDGVLAANRGVPFFSWLEKKYSPIKPKVVPYTGGVAPFLHDKEFSQQCFVTSEPLVAKREGGDPKTFLVADSGYNPYNTVLITRSEYLKKNPELARKMTQAVREGWAEYLKEPKPANEAMAELNKTMDAKTFEKVAEVQKPFVVTSETNKMGLGYMNRDRWNVLINQLAELKVIDKKPKPEDCFKSR